MSARLQRLFTCQEAVRGARANFEAASSRLRLAELERDAAKWASETGRDAPNLHGGNFYLWLKTLSETQGGAE